MLQGIFQKICLVALLVPGPMAVAQDQAAVQPQAAPIEASESAVSELARKEGFSDAVVDKLSQDLLYDLLRTKIVGANRPKNITTDPELVGILVPSVMFICTVFVVFLALLYRTRKTKEVHETLRAMVEKGADIPAELLTPPVVKNADLRKGILLLATGLGLTLLLAIIGIWEPEALKGAGAGLLPGLIGIGYLVVWRLDKKHA